MSQLRTSMGLYATAALAVMGLVLFALAGAYTFRQQELVNKRLCEQTIDNRQGQRITWDAARRLILRTTENPDAINEFFDAILETIPPLECIDNKPVEKEES